MDHSIAVKWARALRSGEYKQGKEVLYRDGAYCCLGVLCDLHRQEVGGEWVNDSLRRTNAQVYQPAGRDDGDEDYALLPDAVREWAGMNSPNPSVRGVPVSHMNDHDGRDFNDLADMIETCSEDL